MTPIWETLGSDPRANDCCVEACGQAMRLWTGKKPSNAAIDQANDRFSGMDGYTKTLWGWWWRGIGGHRLGGFARIRGRDDLRQAVRRFGCAYVGLKHFDCVENHCVLAIECDAAGLTVVTWGLLAKVSWGDFDVNVDQAYAIAPHFSPVLIGLALKNNRKWWLLALPLLPLLLWGIFA